jgi:hypothetical protein
MPFSKDPTSRINGDFYAVFQFTDVIFTDNSCIRGKNPYDYAVQNSASCAFK